MLVHEIAQQIRNMFTVQTYIEEYDGNDSYACIDYWNGGVTGMIFVRTIPDGEIQISIPIKMGRAILASSPIDQFDRDKFIADFKSTFTKHMQEKIDVMESETKSMKSIITFNEV